MEPKVNSPAGGAKAPRVRARAGSNENRSGSASHAPSYSKRMVSVPRTRLRLDIGDLAQTVEQAERLKDASINADTDIGVPCLDLLQRRAGREGALRHDSHWQPPTPTGIVDIGAELAQDAPHGGGRIVWCGHVKPSRYRLVEYVARSLQ